MLQYSLFDVLEQLLRAEHFSTVESCGTTFSELLCGSSLKQDADQVQRKKNHLRFFTTLCRAYLDRRVATQQKNEPLMIKKKRRFLQESGEKNTGEKSCDFILFYFATDNRGFRFTFLPYTPLPPPPAGSGILHFTFSFE